MTTSTQNPARAREDRAEAIGSERRRRKSENINRMNGGFRMDFFEADQLDLDTYVYRWVIDEGTRLYQAQQEDYDFVATSEIKNFNAEAAPITSESSERLSVHAGHNHNGVSERAYLMKKRREWWTDDNEELVQARKSLMDGVIRDGDSQAMNQIGLKQDVYKVGQGQVGGPAAYGGPTTRK